MLLTVTSPAPRWATSNQKAPVRHAARAPGLRGIHDRRRRASSARRSRLYSIWNEPNHPAFLLPQWNSNGTPASPRIYRGLYQAGYAGLQAGGLAHPKVLFGETAPTGYDTVNVRAAKARKALLHDVAPLAFLREALCLNAAVQESGLLQRSCR